MERTKYQALSAGILRRAGRHSTSKASPLWQAEASVLSSTMKLTSSKASAASCIEALEVTSQRRRKDVVVHIEVEGMPHVVDHDLGTAHRTAVQYRKALNLCRGGLDGPIRHPRCWNLSAAPASGPLAKDEHALETVHEESSKELTKSWRVEKRRWDMKPPEAVRPTGFSCT